MSATAKSTTDVTLLRGGKSYGDGGRVYGAHPKVKITAVKPGTYFLTAVDEVRHRYTTRKVTVRAGRTTSVGTLRPAKKTVTIAGTAPRKAGVNVTGAHGAHFEVASASSSYRIRNIVPGRYTIKVMASDLSSSGWNVIRLSRTYSNVRLVKNRRIALKRGPVSGEIRVKYVSPTAHDAVGTPITTTATRKGRTWTTDSDDTGQKARVPWLDTGSYTLTSKLGVGDPEFEDQHSRDNVWSPYYYVMPSPRTVKVVRGKVTSLGVVPLRITGGL